MLRWKPLGTQVADSLAPRARKRTLSRSLNSAPLARILVTLANKNRPLRGTSPLCHATFFAAPVLAAPVLAATVLAVSGCSSSDDSGAVISPGLIPAMTFVSAGNGFADLLPHQAAEFDGNGTQVGPAVALTTPSSVTEAANANLELLASVPFEPSPVLPGGAPGNHYFSALFAGPIGADVLLQFGAGSGLDPALDLGVFSVDPVTGDYARVPARLFVEGASLSGAGAIEPWVEYDATTGLVRALVPDAAGFPGEASVIPMSEDLVRPGSIVAVADSDGDLSTLEEFPAGVSLRFQIPAELPSLNGDPLGHRVVACSTVGVDDIAPEVLGRTQPYVVPAPGAMGVDPAATVTIQFTEPVRFRDLGVGGRDATGAAGLGGALTLVQGTTGFEPPILATVVPESAYDLTRFFVTPVHPFFGQSSMGTSVVPGLDTVIVGIAEGTLGQAGAFQASPSAPAFESRFQVGPGPSLTNAPVAPDAVYAVRRGARSGLSIVDLNGFGQSTGNPVSSIPAPLKGESRFPYNPNVRFQGATLGLTPGTTTLDGGSAGAFTLTRDSNLEDVLATAPLLVDPVEIQLGAALDQALNNAPPPFGCQVGGGYICASSGLKTLSVGDVPVLPGFPNLISVTPHPNPPRLSFPGQCVFPSILGDEPTSVDSASTTNLLVPGDPFGDPMNGIPPTGTPGFQTTTVFAGPSFGQTQLAGCLPYGIRQGLGHFAYVVDRGRSEVVVLNSNRMTVIERIPLPDPMDLTVSPHLDVVAVSNASAGTVSIIDINPNSATFHDVIATIPVGASPRGLVFDPLHEELFVCNEGDDTITIISAGSLTVRKTVPSLVSQPFEMLMTPRMTDFSFRRGVSFGYVLGRDGQVGFYESGPDGFLGIGYDTVVGVIPFQFLNPKAIQLDPLNLDASVYIAHEGPLHPVTNVPGALGDGAISRLRLESALTGVVPLNSVNVSTPSFRDLQFSVPLSLAASQGELSGIPVDIAFDELSNRGGYGAPGGTYTAGTPPDHNGKASFRRVGPAMNVTRAADTQFLFAAIADAGVIDTLRLGFSGTPLLDVDVYEAGVQSIPAPGVSGLSHYWRQ